jgi:hypothetical protein
MALGRAATATEPVDYTEIVALFDKACIVGTPRLQKAPN